MCTWHVIMDITKWNCFILSVRIVCLLIFICAKEISMPTLEIILLNDLVIVSGQNRVSGKQRFLKNEFWICKKRICKFWIENINIWAKYEPHRIFAGFSLDFRRLSAGFSAGFSPDSRRIFQKCFKTIENMSGFIQSWVDYYENQGVGTDQKIAKDHMRSQFPPLDENNKFYLKK